MLNRKELKKVVIGLTPAVIGLVLCFNGLKSVEGELANEIKNGVVYGIENSVVTCKSNMLEPINEVKEEVPEKEEIPEIVDEKIDAKEIIVISKSGLNVRTDNNTESDIVAVYPFATKLTVDTIKGDWYKVDKGYISSEYVMEFNQAVETGVISDIDLEIYDRLNSISTKELNPSVTGISNLSLKDIQAFTSKYPGLKGIEEAAIRAEYEYGINAFMSVAVAALESGYGNSQIAQDKNNLYGMNAQDHNPYGLAYSYNSKYNSTMDFAKRLSKYYVNKGLTTLSAIQKKYSSDSNWDEKVSGIISNIYNIVMSNREKENQNTF